MSLLGRPATLLALIGLIGPGRPAVAAPSALDPHDGRVASCLACHGAAGQGSAALGTPRLAGQNADYLAHALSMFKDRTRESAVMQPVAQSMSDDDMHALADYFSAQHPPLAAAVQPPSLADVRAGQRLARDGEGKTLPSCFSCHAVGGTGNGARFPSIAGQPSTFVAMRLREFQARARSGAARPGSMTAVAAQMTEDQIKSVAAYFSTLSR